MVIFRADGNANIGAGHIMRCLSIAGGIQSNDEAVFVTADEKPGLLLSSVGIRNKVLHTNYSDMVNELGQMQDLIKMHHPTLLFIDSYYVTFLYLSTLQDVCSSVGCKLVYLDDRLEFAYPCDVLLNYNIYGPDRLKDYEKLYRESRVITPKFLLGTSYVPLRLEFHNLPVRIVNENVRDILISTGGSDPEHLTLQLVKEIMSNDLPYIFHFVIGSMNEDAEEIKSLCINTQNIILHQNVNRMSDLMRAADLAISAAGSTLYELCATQTPTLTYILADNQMPGAEGFQKHGIMKCVGDYRTEVQLTSKLIKAAVELAQDYNHRIEIAKKMRDIVDGKGVRRIFDYT